jgi:hypothetical protein
LHRTPIAVGRAFVPEAHPVFARLGGVGHEQRALVVVRRVGVNAQKLPRAVVAPAFEQRCSAVTEPSPICNLAGAALRLNPVRPPAMSASLKQKTLVVADEPEAVELVEFNLKQAGFDAVTAADHATNVAEAVVYLCEAQDIRHEKA